MSGLRVLITNTWLDHRAGSELYVRDLASSLIARGHTPIVYSPILGAVAREIRLATVPVVDDLASVGAPPHVIHGHHHLETLTALLRFPGVPAVSLCHGWLPWQEAPPSFPRVRRYVAVDQTCRDRLVFEHGIPEERVRVLLNFVDLERFVPRRPLPTRPARALAFGNSRALAFGNGASEEAYLPALREACTRAGLTLDVVGLGTGSVAESPEALLGSYDVVFAKARAALEALAVGTSVVLCDAFGAGPLVTSAEFDRLRALNFGIRTLQTPVTVEHVAAEVARYDAADAARVSSRVRAEAGREATVDELVAIYREVIAEQNTAPPADAVAEAVAAADSLRRLGGIFRAEIAAIESHLRANREELGRRKSIAAEAQREVQRLQGALSLAEGEIGRLREGVEASTAIAAELARVKGEIDRMDASTTIQVRNRIMSVAGIARPVRFGIRVGKRAAAILRPILRRDAGLR